MGACVGVAALVAGLAQGAGATPGGAETCPEGVRDRYEPGDEVTVVGYSAGCLAPGDVAAVAAGRAPVIVGYLHSDPCAEVDLSYCNGAGGTVLGHFAFGAATDPERGQRMELTFELPAGLASGLYYVVACREPCTAAGDSVEAEGAAPLYVGVDPPVDGRPVRDWPLDDPAVGSLPDDALIRPDGDDIMTGAEARAAAATEATDTTDLLVVEPEVAAASSTRDAEPWHPPGWWPGAAAALAAAGIPVAIARRGNSTATRARKQVRHPTAGP